MKVKLTHPDHPGVTIERNPRQADVLAASGWEIADRPAATTEPETTLHRSEFDVSDQAWTDPTDGDPPVFDPPDIESD